MIKAAVAPLDRLKVKPQPKTKEDIKIQFPEHTVEPIAVAPDAPAQSIAQLSVAAAAASSNKEIFPESEESIDSDVSMGAEEIISAAPAEPAQEPVQAPEVAPKINIVDLRKNADFHRELIMNKLRNYDRVISPEIAPAAAAPTPAPIVEKPVTKIIRKGKRILIKEPVPTAVQAVTSNEPAPTPLEETVAAAPVPATVAPPPTAAPALKVRGRPRRKTLPPPQTAVVMDPTKITLEGTILAERLPTQKPLAIHRLNNYYMENRKKFLKTIQKLFEPYQEELQNVEQFSCEKQNDSNYFELLTHQKIVRDYLNLYTPYRGLLLFHGLGSGKTCTSIAIAEGMKSKRKIIVMTPASLKTNFMTELKKCGDDMYKRSQFWEFISTDEKPELVPVFAQMLSLTPEYIHRKHGVWLVNIKEHEENFSQKTTEEQKAIDEQLEEMIRSKYMTINYNGLNKKKLDTLTLNGTTNPFDNAVVVIDEAHNFVLRVVNKLRGRNLRNQSISYRLYHYLMSAENARIILLTGTPVINYPNEIAVLFNILRGYIKTWSFQVTLSSGAKRIDKSTILKILEDEGIKAYDYVEYSGGVLTITRNPFHFSNAFSRRKRAAAAAADAGEDDLFENYTGVTLDENMQLTDAEFIQVVTEALKKHHFIVSNVSAPEKYKAFPDEKDDFMNLFVDMKTGNMKNTELFKKRILGLTSYFRSAQEQLLPEFNKNSDFIVIPCEMSDYQFQNYAIVRTEEIQQEKQKSKKKNAAKAGKVPDDLFKKISSSYRIMSRACCNFVFPKEIPRPYPQYKKEAAVTAAAEGEEEGAAAEEGGSIKENVMAVLDEDAVDPHGEEEADKSAENPTETQMMKVDPTYIPRIKRALEELKQDSHRYFSLDGLEIYSTKFLHIIENILDDNHIGLHLIYSTFRTVEGIAILKLILEENGFAEFKLMKDESTGEWSILENEEDRGKPQFSLYTGTETDEEKELLRNVYNGAWHSIPPILADKLRARSPNNIFGEIIKVFMITAAGSEGISLKNTRYVHIVEPFWHPVRVEQVIGRARRICSHQDLPPDLRNVKVFMYLTTFTEAQKKSDKYLDMISNDTTRLSGTQESTPITTDEFLYEVSNLKETITKHFLRAIKETAIDCRIYNKRLGDSGEQLTCYGTVNVKTNDFLSYPSIQQDMQVSSAAEINVRKVEWKARKIIIFGKEYAYREDTNELYDMEQYKDLLEGSVLDIAPIGKTHVKGKKIVGAEFYHGGGGAPAKSGPV